MTLTRTLPRAPTLTSFALSLSVALTATTALAQDAPAQRRAAFTLDASVDVPVIGLTLPVLASWFLADELRAPFCTRCDPATVNAFDRFAAGNYSPAWGTAADAVVFGLDGGLLLTVALTEGFPNAAVDGTVIIESVMVANATAILFNYAISRPRPRLYGDAAPESERTGGLAAMSAFSGHTANAFAATVATFQVLRRVARPALAWTALGVGLALSSFTAVARVAAGSHFPSDVLAGAVVGTSIGWLIPALHRSPVHVAPMAYQSGAGLGLSGAF